MYFQGCSSSMDVPPSFEKRPLVNPSALTDKSKLESDSDIQLENCVGHSDETSTNFNDNIQVNHTQIVMISKDPSRDITLSADSDSIMPLFRNNNERINSFLNENSSQMLSYSNSQANTPLTNEHGLKGVLKTRHQHRSSRHSRTLSNQPIKTVTFLDSVTVVTVY